MTDTNILLAGLCLQGLYISYQWNRYAGDEEHCWP